MRRVREALESIHGSLAIPPHEGDCWLESVSAIGRDELGRECRIAFEVRPDPGARFDFAKKIVERFRAKRVNPPGEKSQPDVISSLQESGVLAILGIVL